jgi:hypothetical protein
MEVTTVAGTVIVGLVIGLLVNGVHQQNKMMKLDQEKKAINRLLDTAISERDTARYQRLKDKQLLETVFSQDMTKYQTATISVNISAYTASVEECDADPSTTADGTPSRIGIIAISPDLRRDFNLAHGQLVLLPPMGIFRIHDSTSTFKRKNTPNPVPITRTVDILHATRKAAITFGFKKDQKLLYVL